MRGKNDPKLNGTEVALVLLKRLETDERLKKRILRNDIRLRKSDRRAIFGNRSDVPIKKVPARRRVVIHDSDDESSDELQPAEDVKEDISNSNEMKSSAQGAVSMAVASGADAHEFLSSTQPFHFEAVSPEPELPGLPFSVGEEAALRRESAHSYIIPLIRDDSDSKAVPEWEGELPFHGYPGRGDTPPPDSPCSSTGSLPFEYVATSSKLEQPVARHAAGANNDAWHSSDSDVEIIEPDEPKAAAAESIDLCSDEDDEVRIVDEPSVVKQQAQAERSASQQAEGLIDLTMFNQYFPAPMAKLGAVANVSDKVRSTGHNSGNRTGKAQSSSVTHPPKPVLFGDCGNIFDRMGSTSGLGSTSDSDVPLAQVAASVKKKKKPHAVEDSSHASKTASRGTTDFRKLTTTTEDTASSHLATTKKLSSDHASKVSSAGVDPTGDVTAEVELSSNKSSKHGSAKKLASAREKSTNSPKSATETCSASTVASKNASRSARENTSAVKKPTQATVKASANTSSSASATSSNRPATFVIPKKTAIGGKINDASAKEVPKQVAAERSAALRVAGEQSTSGAVLTDPIGETLFNKNATRVARTPIAAPSAAPVKTLEEVTAKIKQNAMQNPQKKVKPTDLVDRKVSRKRPSDECSSALPSSSTASFSKRPEAAKKPRLDAPQPAVNRREKSPDQTTELEDKLKTLGIGGFANLKQNSDKRMNSASRSTEAVQVKQAIAGSSRQQTSPAKVQSSQWISPLLRPSDEMECQIVTHVLSNQSSAMLKAQLANNQSAESAAFASASTVQSVDTRVIPSSSTLGAASLLPRSVLRRTSANANDKIPHGRSVRFNEVPTEFVFQSPLDAPPSESKELKSVESIAKFSILDQFMLQILRWNPSWLKEYVEQVSPSTIPPIFAEPDILDRTQLCRFYQSFEDYQSTFFPLLHLEAWESIVEDHDKCSQNPNMTLQLPLTNIERCADGCFVRIRFEGLHSPGFDGFKEYHLITFRLDEKRIFFGIVESVSEAIVKDILQDVPFHARVHYDKGINLQTRRLYTVVVKARAKSNLPDNSFRNLVTLQNVTNLVPTFREVESLGLTKAHPLGPLILNPASHLKSFILQAQAGDKPLANSDEYNSSQTDVIQSCSAAIFSNVSKIGLIHGPPGTGKSKTIAGLMQEVQLRKYQARMKGTIILTAPSNAAIDELARCLILVNQKQLTQGLRIDFVRVGSEKIAEDVRPFTLDARITETFKQRLVPKHSPESNGLSKSQQSDWKAAQEQSKQLETHLSSLIVRGDDPAETKRIRDSLARVTKVCDDFKRMVACHQARVKVAVNNAARPSNQEYGRMRANIIENADVILATLNSSGAKWLQDLLQRVNILAVIVDESCQARELETLIPLKWINTKRLFLVGDPKQLPATVLSQKAKDKNFAQSLFQRLYDCCRCDLGVANPVKLLNTQYRMVPEIVDFPNRHFYDGQIQTDKSVVQPAGFPFRPYLMFDLIYGEESKSEDNASSFVNLVEAQFIFDLVNYVRRFSIATKDIGIVTFYSGQKQEILKRLHAKSYLRATEVNTVDGFQGRQKKIIIVSCVRAFAGSAGGGSIGFLEDPRRLNVAITRAQHALYIVGNRKSLCVDSDWKALCDDASARSCLKSVSERGEATGKFDKSFAVLRKSNLNSVQPMDCS